MRVPFKKLCVLTAVVVAAAGIASCVSAPADQPEPIVESLVTEPVEPVEPSPEPVAIEQPAPFDPDSVSVEMKQATFFDVRALIQGLNSIIQAKDYESWSMALTDAYRSYYSSPDTLARISEAPVLKRQGVKLRSLQDYFVYVVYPSRQNDRVDDIEFIDATHIRAITVNAKGERLVLYNLEKIGDTWKIAIWR
ncbi:MAG TPA: hypothetical protein P5298_02820 [Spirochaetia bacterium]|nr:hypothetical protein [Spirochaetaceae bacterium]HPE87907.1 hypothetical protein [Spirochaetales bacterium]HRW23320.1 hypothetical protein [Spirochaetia bacterium]